MSDLVDWAIIKPEDSALRRILTRTSLTTRLVIVVVVLILLTTLSAGVPAFLLARSQLEAQARQRVEATARGTQSLYDAAERRVVDLAALLAERPTLRRLIEDDDVAAIEPYLRAFQEQSELDVIILCDGERVVVTTEVSIAVCPANVDSGVYLLDGRPVLLASQSILSSSIPETIGTVMAASWLDVELLTQLSANTGAEQTILDADGQPLASTLSPGVMIIQRRGSGLELAGDGRSYLISQFSLPGQHSNALLAEVALPIDDLQATERTGLLVLTASTAIIALVGVAAGVWYIRRLTAPLLRLTGSAEQISQGDLAAPIPRLAGPPELATLSASLEKSQATMLTALEERSQARDWLNTLIQSVVEGVVTFDTRGRVTFMSQGAELLSGWTSAEAVGQPIDHVFPLADAADGQTFLDHIPPAGDKREIEVRTRSGKTVVVAATGARLVPPNSDTVQVALVLRDVTEEQALRNLRSFFLANISHEFRTPLSTLNASIELLIDQVDDLSPGEIRELLSPTHLSLLSLQSLIDNLLESSSIEAGSFRLRRRVVNLEDVMAEALTIVRPLMERRRQAIAVSEPARMPTLSADRARLTQALVNLLANASKYSPIGCPIDLNISQTRDVVRLAVADRGPGVSPEDRVNLFRRFMRLDTQAGDEQYGIGLGLYLVKRIAEAHGGQVGVDDRPGGGAVFWMDFPLMVEESSI
ncbi:MAG TPA: ATP-binding protein [Promineifilum sp.]|nr:ATP-binding protein [Promineifilum sp.]